MDVLSLETSNVKGQIERQFSSPKIVQIMNFGGFLCNEDDDCMMVLSSSVLSLGPAAAAACLQ